MGFGFRAGTAGRRSDPVTTLSAPDRVGAKSGIGIGHTHRSASFSGRVGMRTTIAVGIGARSAAIACAVGAFAGILVGDAGALTISAAIGFRPAIAVGNAGAAAIADRIGFFTTIGVGDAGAAGGIFRAPAAMLGMCATDDGCGPGQGGSAHNRAQE